MHELKIKSSRLMGYVWIKQTTEIQTKTSEDYILKSYSQTNFILFF